MGADAVPSRPMTNDLHTILDTLVAIAATEVIIKPTIIRVGRYLLARLDGRLGFIPDFLHHE
jgi:hypothetical protein